MSWSWSGRFAELEDYMSMTVACRKSPRYSESTHPDLQPTLVGKSTSAKFEIFALGRSKTALILEPCIDHPFEAEIFTQL